MFLPKIPLGEGIEILVDLIDDYLGWLLDGISVVLDFLVSGLYDLLLFIPEIVLIVALAALVWYLSRRDLGIAAVVAIGLILVWNLNLWDEAMETLALVIVSAFTALAIGIPLGILSARHDLIDSIMRPILDFMQTMPSFVYLIPAVIFFGLGNVPGMIATVIFAMPPSIRLTNLGIRQISKELIEVADAFGSTSQQKLVKVQLPVALPTIMAGVNQCIMLALSMTVIASMIGARGLGYLVLVGIQRVDIGGGFEAGLGIVIIAIVLDRISQNLVKSP
ncbi:MAG: proline/glycine betaine ABC transporter permease [Methanomicrobiaceae archaeon]|nr:proline/glycine betaine ABC transporter permease [Methanomicrobiaceae archaeon]